MAAKPSNPCMAVRSRGPECTRSNVTPVDQSPLKNRPKASPVASSPHPVKGRAQIMCRASCQRWSLSGAGSSLRRRSGDTMTTRRTASMAAVEATAARTALLPLSAKTSSVRPPAIAPRAPLREVVATRPPAITARPSHQATMKRPPCNPRAMASGAAIAMRAPRRFAFPRFPSGRNPTFRATCARASRHATAVPKTNAGTTQSRERGSRKSQTGNASSPR